MKIIRYNFFIGILLIIIMLVSSCSIETYATKKNDANQEILSYIIDNNIVISFGMKEDKHIFI